MIIRRFNITVSKFIKMFLPPYKRQANRELLFYVALYPLKVLQDEYADWRDKETIRSYVTGETDNLVWYLNTLFDPVYKRIYIETNEGGGVVKGIRGTEPDLYQVAGIRGTEPTLYTTKYLKGEDAVLGFKKFGVYIPSDIAAQAEDIKGVVNNYRFAGKTFMIITF